MTEQSSPRTEPETALVTGAARRIGRALAADLARTGWRVAAHHNGSAADAAALVDEIRAAGGRAEAFQADLSDEAQVLDLIPRAAAGLGPVTCLINNASVFEEDSPFTATRESWDRHVAVNLRAPFVLIQEMARALPDGLEGCVINILDQRVWNLRGDFTSYTLSKYALWGLTQTLARGLAPRVRVNGVGPGPTLPSSHQTQDQFDREWRETPLSRPIATDDICAAARFILDAPALTGQMIALDSGQHMGAQWGGGAGPGKTDDGTQA